MDLKTGKSKASYHAKENAHSSLVVPSLYIKKPINQYQTSQNVSFIFRIPKDFKSKIPNLCHQIW